MTNNVFAAPPPEPPANPHVTNGGITCDSTCTATGNLAGAPESGGPYTVTASGEVTTTSEVSKEVSQRIIKEQLLPVVYRVNQQVQ